MSIDSAFEALLKPLEGRLPAESTERARELVFYGEPFVALEILADNLYDGGVALTVEDCARVDALAIQMGKSPWDFRYLYELVPSGWVDDSEERLIKRYGMPPFDGAADAIRADLTLAIAAERSGQGDTLQIRLLCAQLFCFGEASDALRVAEAKRASFDAGFSIDLELLCPAGLEAARRVLGEASLDWAVQALDHACQSGDLDDFEPLQYRAQLVRYYT